jgi:hypothetical protein
MEMIVEHLMEIMDAARADTSEPADPEPADEVLAARCASL